VKTPMCPDFVDTLYFNHKHSFETNRVAYNYRCMFIWRFTLHRFKG